jgi:hypothetical protein
MLVYDADTPITAVPRRSTTDLNRTKAKHQIATASAATQPREHGRDRVGPASGR